MAHFNVPIVPLTTTTKAQRFRVQDEEQQEYKDVGRRTLVADS